MRSVSSAFRQVHALERLGQLVAVRVRLQSVIVSRRPSTPSRTLLDMSADAVDTSERTFARSLSKRNRQPALAVFTNPATASNCQAEVLVGRLPPDQRRVLLAGVCGSRAPPLVSPLASSLSEARGQPALTVFDNPATAGDGFAHVFVGRLAPDQRGVFAGGSLDARREGFPLCVEHARFLLHAVGDGKQCRLRVLWAPAC